MNFILPLALLMTLDMPCSSPKMKVHPRLTAPFLVNAVNNANKNCKLRNKCIKSLDINYDGRYHYTCENQKLD